MASSFENNFTSVTTAPPVEHGPDAFADDSDREQLERMVAEAWECLKREARRRTWLPRRQRRDGYQWRRQGVSSRRVTPA